MVMRMKLLKIKDNTQHKKEIFSDIPNLTGKIADKTLEQLENEGVFVFPEYVNDAKDITQDQMILQSINDTYRSSNVMGFLGCGDERLIIESRFSCKGDDYFFQYLLDKVLDFPNIVNLNSNANQDNRLFNFLLFLFPYYLKSAMRKGLFKKYIHHRYNDGNVKGTIDIARHIEKNTPFTGKVAYSQREFSYDNDLMELIRHTIEFIKRKPYGHSLLAKVTDEVKLVVGATPRYEVYDRQRIIEQNKKNAVRHAYFREYLALQRLCLLILRHQKHQLGLGSRQIYGILFDGAWLWEEYINSLIKDVFYHPMNKGSKGAQRLFEGNIGLIYPDFISRDTKTRVIADAKYKPVDHIGNRDYLQVLAYMFRFDAKTGYYLYPEVEDTDDLILQMNSGSTYEKNVTARGDISLTKHGLKIPTKASDYSEFVMKIKAQEQAFIKIFSK
jgi:5-methylcytosine-specific restriction endonuclease McrBC regulatory subunit McrC